MITCSGARSVAWSAVGPNAGWEAADFHQQSHRQGGHYSTTGRVPYRTVPYRTCFILSQCRALFRLTDEIIKKIVISFLLF